MKAIYCRNVSARALRVSEILRTAMAIGVSVVGCGGISSAATAQEAADESAASFGEIIVTAQRRSETAREVPISIVSQTGEQLERSGISNITDISKIATGVKIDQIGAYLQPSIRGVSSLLSGIGLEAPVALYIDGVIQPNQLANYLEFVDLERIEVAKGPQGTLFGRNATGGAISVFTKDPSVDPTGSVSIGYGNYNDFVAKGYLSGAIVPDVLSASVSGFYRNHDGYDRDIVTGQRTEGFEAKIFRGKLHFTPSDRVKFTLSAQYQDRFDRDALTGVAVGRNTPAAADPDAIIAVKPRTISADYPNYIRVKATSLGLIGEFIIPDAGVVKSITGYGDIRTRLSLDADRSISDEVFLASDYAAPEKYFSQELSFASEKFGPFSFVSGLYYYKNTGKFENLRSYVGPKPGVTAIAFNSKVPVTAWAAFTEANWELTDRLKVIGGLRYSWEKRSNYGSAVFDETVPVGFDVFGGETKFDAWTPRVSVTYEAADRTNVYFTYSRGFKSGGVTSGGFLGIPAFDPETIDAYELGLKSVLSGDFSFNLAAYYYKYKNLQIQFQLSVAAAIFLNAASAEIKGLDADFRWRPINGLSLGGGLSLLSAKYDDFPDASVLRPGTAGNMVVSNVDLSGNYMTRAPKLSGTLVADYLTEVGSGELGANATFSYAGTTYYDSDNRVKQKPYATLNLLLSYALKDRGLKFEIWGKNITNKTYLGSVMITDSDSIGYAPPRTYGATASYAF